MKRTPGVFATANALGLFGTPVLAGLLAAGCALLPAGDAGLPVPPLGLAIGEPGESSAVIWSKGIGPSTMRVQIARPGQRPVIYQATAIANDDFTARVTAHDLQAESLYEVYVRFVDSGGAALTQAVSGRFRTAPAATAARPLRFLFGADLAGQNVCRDAGHGFPIFTSLSGIEADFFVALGDIIYADALCAPVGKYGNSQIPGEFPLASSLPDYHAHWRYSFADPGLQALRRRMGYVAIWDDHEVVNDFGPGRDRHAPNGPPLMAPGLAAFIDYNPLAVAQDTAPRLYRSMRWGHHAELFLLDTRQYRDDNDLSDQPEQPKTLLGNAQRNWLIDAAGRSTATWKIVVSSVPLSIPTGWPPDTGRDGWASGESTTGFENELLGLLRSLRDAGTTNLLWLSADVHFATGFVYRPFADSSDFVVYELITGPLNAGLFAKEDVDMTLNPERLFFYGPEDFASVATFDEALGWMNIGLVEIDDDGTLHFELIDGKGQSVAHVVRAPAP